MEYSSNSHKSKELVKDKTIETVSSENATIKKKDKIHEFKNSIIAEDMHTVSSYILSDIIIPSFKKVIKDIVTSGIDMLLYGSVSGSKSSMSKVSYSNYWSDSRPSNPISKSSSFDYDDLLFDDRGQAEAALSMMCEILDCYGVVSISDFYEIYTEITHKDIPSPGYTANKYGWTSIRSAQTMRWREGYIIKLPKAVPI